MTRLKLSDRYIKDGKTDSTKRHAALMMAAYAHNVLCASLMGLYTMPRACPLWLYKPRHPEEVHVRTNSNGELVYEYDLPSTQGPFTIHDVSVFDQQGDHIGTYTLPLDPGLAQSTSGLPPAYNVEPLGLPCECDCHRWPGVVHCVPCCSPLSKDPS